jgi:phage-related protein (TIGR01555 family)
MKPTFLSRLFRSDSTPAAPSALVGRRRRDTTTLTSSSFLPMGVSAGAWGNGSSGLGIEGYDPTRQLAYSRGCIPSAQLVDSLYTHDWLADRIIELMPSTAMVRGFTLKGGADDDLMARWQELNFTERFPHGAFQRAVNDGRAYGAAVALLGYAKGNPASALEPGQLSGGINFIDVFGQHELRVLTRFDDPSQGNFGMPELYEVIAASSGPTHPRTGQIFHSSRSIRFAGRPLRVPNTSLELVGEGPEIGVSVLTPVLNVIAQYGLAWSALSNMLQDASIGVLKLSGLVDALASEDKAIVEDRLAMLQQTKSVHRMMFLDADNAEDYTRTEVSLTDVPQMIQQFMVAVSGAADAPARIFFSSSPSGLNANASGNADLSQFYAKGEDYQRRYLGPKLGTMLTAINGGQKVDVEWPTLWDSSENEKAQTRTANSNADKIYWDMGYSAEQIGKARATGTFIELTGESPADDREEVASAGAPDPGAVPPRAPPVPQGPPRSPPRSGPRRQGRNDRTPAAHPPGTPPRPARPAGGPGAGCGDPPAPRPEAV